MPRWVPHSGNWFGARSRYHFKERLGEILTGVIPVALVETFLQADYTENAFAAGAQSWDPHLEGDAAIANPGQYHSVTLHNPIPASGRNSVECLVYRVTGFQATGAATAQPAGHPLNYLQEDTTALRIHTALESYFDGTGGVTFTRSNIGGAGVGQAAAWLQMGVGPQLDQLRLPVAHLDCGVHTSLPVVSVGGVNQFAVGPMMAPSSGAAGSEWPGSLFEAGTTNYLRLKPGQRLMVQGYRRFGSFVANNNAVFASFWWVERPWEEPLP